MYLFYQINKYYTKSTSAYDVKCQMAMTVGWSSNDVISQCWWSNDVIRQIAIGCSDSSDEDQWRHSRNDDRMTYVLECLTIVSDAVQPLETFDLDQMWRTLSTVTTIRDDSFGHGRRDVTDVDVVLVEVTRAPWRRTARHGIPLRHVHGRCLGTPESGLHGRRHLGLDHGHRSIYVFVKLKMSV